MHLLFINYLSNIRFIQGLAMIMQTLKYWALFLVGTVGATVLQIQVRSVCLLKCFKCTPLAIRLVKWLLITTITKLRTTLLAVIAAK